MDRERMTGQPPEAAEGAKREQEQPAEAGHEQLDIEGELMSQIESQSNERQEEGVALDAGQKQMDSLVVERGNEYTGEEASEVKVIDERKDEVIKEADEKSAAVVAESRGSDSPFNAIKGLEKIRLEQPVEAELAAENEGDEGVTVDAGMEARMAEVAKAAEEPTVEASPAKDVDSGMVAIKGAMIGAAVAERAARDKAAAANVKNSAVASETSGKIGGQEDEIEITPDMIEEEIVFEEAKPGTPPEEIIELTERKEEKPAEKPVEIDSEYQKELAAAEAQEATKAEAAREREQQRHEMQSKGAEIAQLTADLKKFDGMGKLRMVSANQRLEKEAMLEKLSDLKGEYSELRKEVVGGDLIAALNEQEAQVERIRSAMESGGGRLEKIGRGFYNISKKMGELNLGRLAEKMGMEPKSRLGKMLLRAASVRTGIGAALLGGGLALGAGTAGGAAALLAKRLSGGAFASVGSYDLMKGVADRRADKFTGDELKKMPLDEVQERMAKIQARAAAGGKGVAENPAYEQLKEKFMELANIEKPPDESATEDIDKQWEAMSQGQVEQMSIEDIAAWTDAREKALEGAAEAAKRLNLENMMADADAKLEDRMKKDARNDRYMKGAAIGLGALIGSGAMAKGIGWAGEQSGIGDAYRSVRDSLKDFLGIEGGGAAGSVGTKEIAPAAALEGEPGAAAGAAASETPAGIKPEAASAAAAAAETSPDSGAEKLKQLAEIRKGDGYSHIIKRQLMADPERFGYNPATDGDVDKWARKTTGGILREKGLVGGDADTRLRFNANKPGGIVLERTADGKFDLAKVGNVKEYVYRQPEVDPDQILKESVEATRKGMAEAAAESEPSAVQEVIQEQYGNDAKGLVDRGVSRDELLRAAREPAIGGKEVFVKGPDGKPISLGDGIEAKLKAMAALDQMDTSAIDAKDAVSEAIAEKYGGSAQSLLDKGVSRQSLMDAARQPAIAGKDVFVTAADGSKINLGSGIDAKYKAMAALDKLDLANAATPSEEVGFKPKTPEWAQDTGQEASQEAGRTAVETKLTGGGYDMLKQDWAKNLKGASFDRSMAMDMAEQDIRELAAHKKALADLVADGKGNSAEAARLAKDINNDIAFIKSEHGDILTPDAAKAVEVPRLATASEAAPETEPSAVTEIKTGSGAELKFNYGPDGKISGVAMEGRMGMKDIMQARDTLKDNILEEMRKHGVKNPSLAQSLVQSRANSLHLMREGIKSLAASGQGDSEAANYLKKMAENLVKTTEQRYGDVFK